MTYQKNAGVRRVHRRFSSGKVPKPWTSPKFTTIHTAGAKLEEP